MKDNTDYGPDGWDGGAQGGQSSGLVPLELALNACTRGMPDLTEADCMASDDQFDLATAAYMLDSLGDSVGLVDLGWLTTGVLGAINERRDKRNVKLGKSGCAQYGKLKALPALPSYVTAEVIRRLRPVCCINLAFCSGELDLDKGGTDGCLLGLYDADPESPSWGTYVTEDSALASMVRRLRPSADGKYIKDVREDLIENAPRVTPYREGRLIPVANGLFDDVEKVLLPFSPEHVFLNKMSVPYDPAAAPVFIADPATGTTWDLDSWIAALNDDPEVVAQIWMLLAALIRPGRAYDKAVLLYSPVGCNGKGTLMAMVQRLLGSGAMVGANLSQMGNSAYLEKVPGTFLIYGDENEVSTYLDNCTNFKQFVTHEAVSVNRKYKSVVSVYFDGLIVQNLNGLPRFRDKTSSLTRRLLIIPFDKNFKGLGENKAIKHDYVVRPEVLTYLLKKLLMMTDVELRDSAASLKLMEEFKEENSSVLTFLNEMLDKLVWGVVPMMYLHDLYSAWYRRAYAGSGKPTGRQTFAKEVADILADSDDWIVETGEVYMKQEDNDRYQLPEPLTAEYDLVKWADEDYWRQGVRHGAALVPPKKKCITGVLRRVGWQPPTDDDMQDATAAPTESHTPNKDQYEGAVLAVEALAQAGIVEKPTLMDEKGKVIWRPEWGDSEL